MHNPDRKIALRIFLVALVYLAMLVRVLGTYPGYNYDSYQYAYAAFRGAELSGDAIAEFSRMHVHAGYYPLWRLFVISGLPAWSAFAWFSVLCASLTSAAVYLICRTLSVARALSALAALFFLSSTSTAYYATIPEVYSPWMLLVALFVWAALTDRQLLAGISFGLGVWMFLESLLLWPVFWLSGKSRSWLSATLGLLLGALLHVITLSAYRIPFLPRLASETVYFRVITGWQWFFTSTWNALSQAGVLWVGILYVFCCLRARKSALLRRLEMVAVPALLLPAIWVKDQGSFFLPFILLIAVLGIAALNSWVGRSRTRGLFAIVLCCVVMLGNIQATWAELGDDRNAGRAQLAYCRSALEDMPENSRLISTALLSTWLWVCAETGRDDVRCSYFPWMLRADYGPVLDASLQELTANPGTYYIDTSVSARVSEAGRIVSTWEIKVPAWPKGSMTWPLKVIDIGGTRP